VFKRTAPLSMQRGRTAAQCLCDFQLLTSSRHATWEPLAALPAAACRVEQAEGLLNIYASRLPHLPSPPQVIQPHPPAGHPHHNPSLWAPLQSWQLPGWGRHSGKEQPTGTQRSAIEHAQNPVMTTAGSPSPVVLPAGQNRWEAGVLQL
jgi:hypothetical protein